MHSMSDGLTYDREWFLELGFAGTRYIVAWEFVTSVEYGNSEHYLNTYEVTDKGEKYVKESGDENELKIQESLIQAAIAFRKSEIRKDYDLNMLWTQEEKGKEWVMDIINRAFAGEYMGQYRNEHLYVQDVMDIFDQPLASPFNKVFRELVEAKKIGLEGNIFITYEQYEENRAYAKESSGGHQDYHVNDYGDWFCGYCGNSADNQEGISATTIPCVKKS
jgi:hypothetical protein